MDIAAIRQLLEPYAKLDEQRLRLTSTYIDLLLKWNARINLTAVRGPQEMVTRHFGESFFAAERLWAEQTPARVIDLGSGAGFPGLPIAMMRPEAHVVLIESNHKKVTFLREVIFALGLKNAEVFAGRGETYGSRCDLVTMRAVERFEDSMMTALDLLEPGGRIALMIGRAQEERARELGVGVEWSMAMIVPGGHSRILLVGAKNVIVGQESVN